MDTDAVTEETPQLPFQVADWEVDPASGWIRRGGITRKLEPRVMDLLVVLAQQPGVVVAREELEARVWSGMVVGYDALSSAMIKLRKALGDDPHHPLYIETLPKKGYRLIAPVSAGSSLTNAEQEAPSTLAFLFLKPGFRFAFVVLACIVTLVSVFLLWFDRGRLEEKTSVTQDHTPSIAVLPFENLNGDKEQQYFAEGITDDLITDLSKISGLLVISRDSVFYYKDKVLDIDQVADKLNVRYILHGSVRRAGENIRINAQLVDVDTGGNLWAERYDGNLAKIEKLQDTILQKIVSALQIKLSSVELERITASMTDSPQAYDYFLYGQSHFLLYANEVENNKARKFYQRAIEIDPKFARAYAMLAWTHWFEFTNGWSKDPEDSLKQAYELARKAIQIDESTPVAYFVTGLVYREKKEYVKALAEVEKAVSIDPNYANAHVLLATLLYYGGRPEEGLQRMLKAIRLNPYYPTSYPFHLGQAYFVLQRYNEAIDAFEQGVQSYPDSLRLHVWLAASYAQVGRKREAEWESDQVKILDPEFSIEKMKDIYPFKDPVDLERFLAGLRSAGLGG